MSKVMQKVLIDKFGKDINDISTEVKLQKVLYEIYNLPLLRYWYLKSFIITK